ncbi:MAG: exodeoxyribonuclease V subunit beta, partial [Cocleimonas sp.]|nr:exodeoxyribonuclease V subunit beta [Cocleimonas sp.]
PQTVPLTQSNLIEASAGTGKTYTLSLLYLRFVLESEPALSVDKILVVTYTSAATKELKDRIRMRLSEALRAFMDPNKAKGEYEELCTNFSDHGEAIIRLNRTLLNFDEASIFTIHSFCQRALKDTAFDAALAFKTELLDNDYDLMQSLMDDYWRKNFQKAPAALLSLLRNKEITPDTLLNDIRIAVGKPYLKRLQPEFTVDIGEQAQQLEEQYRCAIKIWQSSADEIENLLRNHKGLYAAVLKSLDEMMAGMRILAANSADKSPAELPAKVDKLTPTKLKVKKGHDPITHAFFESWEIFLDSRNALEKSLADYHNVLRNQVLDYLQQTLSPEKRRKGVMSFDDLLLQLQTALQQSTTLAQTLAKKYQVAMIDEFQDTDPIQYDIFQRIYAQPSSRNAPQDTPEQSNVVFFVGDPKQAIYSFRGADIYTYLKASQDTQQQYTLNTNWRSHPNLIDALNQLFSRSDYPFYDASIAYQPVTAGQGQQPSLNTSDARAPLRLWKIEDTDDKKKSTLMADIAELVADDITRLLIAADKGEAIISGRPIEGGDIAILVRSNKQGQQMKAALTQRGVTCVQSSKESLFETREAQDLYHLLLAIAQPSQEDQVRRALVGDFFAYCGEDLLHFDEDSSAWDAKLQAFHHWHQLWLKQGFIPMMRVLMRDEQVQTQLLSYSDGERRLTNLLHLSELIHSESRENSRGMEGTIRWLRQQARQTTLSSDSLQLRLESDAKLVQIVTVHKSKGLEYGLIYCPFLWADSVRSSSSDAAIMFHADDDAHTPCLDIGSAQRDHHLQLLEEEAYAENMRLLYVALTRAKYHCTVVALTEKINRYIDRSALGWLLSNGVAAKNRNFLGAYQQNLKALVSESNGMISAESLPEGEEGLHYQSKQTPHTLNAREFSVTIKQDYRVSSFSGLTSGNHSQAHDHDSDDLFNQPRAYHHATNEFPRGANAGSCLHEIYENSNFTQPLIADNEQQNAIHAALDKWGFSEELADIACALINNSLQAPLPPLDHGFSLANLNNSQRLNEMEFYLPLAVLQVDELKQILFKHLPSDNWQLVRNAVSKLSFEQVSGYLKGYIDLIFEYQGQYFVADYKSNTLENYDHDGMLEAMAHSHYYLQYLIYSVALHRYLAQRIINYDYQTHFGGVYYLFIRG